MKNTKFLFTLMFLTAFSSTSLFSQIQQPPPMFINPYNYGQLHNTKLKNFYADTFGAGDTSEGNVEYEFRSQRFAGFGGDTKIVSVIEGNLSASSHIDQTSASSDVKSKLKQILTYINNYNDSHSLFIAISGFEQSLENDQRLS